MFTFRFYQQGPGEKSGGVDFSIPPSASDVSASTATDTEPGTEEKQFSTENK